MYSAKSILANQLTIRMSDILIVPPSFSSTGNMLFAKNSGREPNEAQSILRIPAQEQPDEVLMCTYISIPQVAYTHEILVSKPYHTWGVEMGTNHHGLAVGNVPVFTRLKKDKKNQGLSGSDLVRLALERTSDARTAIELIASLLEQYGQDAMAGYGQKAHYHNSFVVADPSEAWLMETAGKEWVAARIQAPRAISGFLSIGNEYELSSPGVEQTARTKGWVPKGQDFHFAKAYTHRLKTWLKRGKKRASLAQEQLQKAGTAVSVAHLMEILRSHHPGGKRFHPGKASGASVCMHANGRMTPFQTNGSLIAELRAENNTTCWLTGTSSPCLSLYKPFFIPGISLNEGLFDEPVRFIDRSLWWQAEVFHREVFANYRNNKKTFEAEQTELQQRWIEMEKFLFRSKPDGADLKDFSDQALRIHLKKIKEWRYFLQKNPQKWSQFSPFYRRWLRKLTAAVRPVV